MIVEIHGIDEERMKKLEQVLISFAYPRRAEFDKKVCVSADMGTAELVNTHRDVFGAYGSLIFLREPGEFCVTLEGTSLWAENMLKYLFLMTDIPITEQILKILNQGLK